MPDFTMDEKDPPEALPAFTKEEEVIFSEYMDNVNIPRVASTGAELTFFGRVIIAVEKADKLQTEVDRLKEGVPAAPDLNQAGRRLLAEAFPFLAGFVQTADLRQRIKLFLEPKL